MAFLRETKLAKKEKRFFLNTYFKWALFIFLIAFVWNADRFTTAFWIYLLLRLLLLFCRLFFCQTYPALWDCNRYFWFWKPFNMVQGGVEFSFLEGIDVGIDIRIYIFISIRPMTAKCDKHLDIELTQVRLIKHVLTTPHVKITWQTKNISSLLDCLSPPKSWHDDKLPWWAPDHKVTWFFDHMVLQDKVKPLYLHSSGAPSLEGRQLTLGGSYQ